MGCTLEGGIFLFFHSVFIQYLLSGNRSGHSCWSTKKQTSTDSTRVPSRSSPPNPMTCLRNWVLPSLPDPCWPAVLHASRRGPETVLSGRGEGSDKCKGEKPGLLALTVLRETLIPKALAPATDSSPKPAAASHWSDRKGAKGGTLVPKKSQSYAR